MANAPFQDDLLTIALLLVKSVKKILREKGQIALSNEPEPVFKPITQFANRMRIDALEKFSERTVFSTINFYLDEQHMEQHSAIGALVLYIPVALISNLMHILEYPRIDEDNDEEVLDACGTVTNLIAGTLVKEMKGLGYVHLEMSHFQNSINTALNGIEFPFDQERKCELRFEISGRPRIVAEVVMGKVPRY